MAEAVRLVVWDLDETFWGGTLTEGGITYRPECHEIVRELARRGIMSTICSKNNLAEVQAVLEEHGIWDSFIFPSVNWEPKGPRIAALVDTVQLRAATIMLIDDNPMNLNEARHFVPDIQTESEAFIPRLLDDPRFRGKDDRGLTRLAQYKTLERRHAEEVQAVRETGSNQDFLRASNITVQIDYDLDDKIDRVVELINRTNQMNFTKRRLSEDPAKAAAEARALLGDYGVQAGLLRVTDRYGDYGYAGFYAMSSRASREKLLHFCFSCRILNMGVEQWLYRRLGRPELTVAAPVSSDPFDEAIAADWITLAGAPAGAAAQTPRTLGTVAIHGGCNLAAVGHYFRGAARELIEEFDLARENHGIRTDHSHMLRLAIEGASPEIVRAAEAIGYRAEDFATRLGSLPAGSCVLLSFTMDSALATYRHRALGFRVPFWKTKHVPGTLSSDLTRADPAAVAAIRNVFVRDALQALARDYDYEGPISEAAFKDNLRAILGRMPADARVAVLGANEHGRNPAGKLIPFPRARAINEWTRQVLRDHPEASFLDVVEFIHDESEVETIAHFSRMVYFRIYQHLAERFGAPAPAGLQLAS